MDRTGEQARRSICDDIGAQIDASSVVKALTLAWLLPGMSLIWAGFASSGIRTADGEAARHALEQTQALAVMLAIFHTVVCAIWALRTWDDLPDIRFGSREGRPPVPPGLHVALGVVAVGGLIAGQYTNRSEPLLIMAACCGFGASLILLRAAAIAPVFRPATLSAFAAAMLFQVTIGWLHLLAPTGPLAVALIAQGLVLAWTAIAATREFASVQRAVRHERSSQFIRQEVIRHEVTRQEVIRKEMTSQEPGLQPLPGPMVGH